MWTEADLWPLDQIIISIWTEQSELSKNMLDGFLCYLLVKSSSLFCYCLKFQIWLK